MTEFKRDKILPEDLIQRTNLSQHNMMIDAINDIDGRQGDIEHITNVNIDDITDLKTDVDALNDAMLVVSDELETKVPISDKGVPEGVATLDVSGKVPSSQIPALDSAKITTGTLSSARLPVFTNSALGGIKGSATAGRISANADGTGSVNGWDDKFNKSGGNLKPGAYLGFKAIKGDYTVRPTGWTPYGIVRFHDKNNVLTGQLTMEDNENGNRIMYMNLRDENNVMRWIFQVGITPTGETYTTVPMRATPVSTDAVNYEKLLSAQSDIMSSVANIYARADAVGVANGIASLDATGKIPIAQLPSELGAPIYQHNISYEMEQSSTKHKCYFTLYNTISSPMTANEILAYFDDLGSVHPATGYIVATSNYNIYGIAGIGNYNELVIACVKADFSQGNVQTMGFADNFTDKVRQIV